MFDLTSVTWLHIEPTSRCNAWCPGCSRNLNGFKINPDLNITDLNIDILDNTIKRLPNLESVQMCGNDGDPCAAKNIDEQLDLIASYPNIILLRIHTNGSLRPTEWWGGLSRRFKNIHIVFAIDGLADTHSIYRQGTNWEKIINNAKAFISSGGHAVWQFIPFAHNEHQIVDCYNMSQKLGFKKFHLLKRAVVPWGSKHYQTGELTNIKPWSKGDGVRLDHINTANNIIETSDCMHLSGPSVYLDAQGDLYPCCMLAREYFNDETSYPKEGKEDWTIPDNFSTNNVRKKCLYACGRKQ